MKFKDYYETLGVSRDASQDDIKSAYRKLARKYHPDVSKEADAEARFKEIGEAYKVLKDAESRASYDRLGANWQNGQDFQPPGGDAGFDFRSYAGGAGGAGTAGGFEGMDFGDFFEQMFSRQASGRSQQRTMQMPGEDVHARIEIDLEDAYRGAERTISLRMPDIDEHGHHVQRERSLRVTIPKGVRAGQNLRLSGQGGPGFNGGKVGDLYLEIAFRSHARYRVDGRDVYLNLPLAPWEAALGASIGVDTPDGKVEVTIPSNSAAGRKLRLKGRGIPGKSPGDLYVVLNIVLPPAHSEADKQAYRTWQAAFDFNPRAAL
ncbi:DnaJ C-terminal domain-containing protein [uncultured Oxalicibacterium sp.]|uniref:DnaJ C-terminal domain-containing protein n=1 Tax=uncultured Oxalicibacterium sp. TaxID=1168540 RepID=UPI0025D37AE8|nr:DnaJ C-terminal domain-containing protein [uncultured Oxalicibacterium sp.]